MTNPIKVTVRTIMVDEGVKKSTVIRVWTAYFENGKIEQIKKSNTVNTDLLVPSNFEVKELSKDVCALYYCGKWSKWGEVETVRGKDSAATYRKQSPMPAMFARSGKKVVANPFYSAAEQVQRFLREVQNWADYNIASVEDNTYNRMKEAARNVSYAFASWRINSKQMGQIMDMTSVSLFNLIYKLHTSVDFLNQESVAEYINIQEL